MPAQFKTLAEHQARLEELANLPEVFPDGFSLQVLGDAELICFHQNSEDKVVLTNELFPKAIKFCHESMARAKGAG